MDPVALREDERAHLGVPAARLVAEVDAGLQQLPHRDGRHGARTSCSVSFRRGPRRRVPVRRRRVARLAAGTVPVGTVRVWAPRRREPAAGGAAARWPAARRSVARGPGSGPLPSAGRRCGSEGRPVVADADGPRRRPGLDDHEVERGPAASERRPPGSCPSSQPPARPRGARALAVVERLLGQPERARRRASRTSTTTSAGGGPGSIATRSSSSRPTRTFRARIVQPAASRRAATRASAASPSRCAAVRPASCIRARCARRSTAAHRRLIRRSPAGAADTDRGASTLRRRRSRCTRRWRPRASGRGRCRTCSFGRRRRTRCSRP